MSPFTIADSLPWQPPGLSGLPANYLPLEKILAMGYRLHSIVFKSSGIIYVNFSGTIYQDVLTRGELSETFIKLKLAKLHPAYEPDVAKPLIYDPHLAAEDVLLRLNDNGVVPGVGIAEYNPVVEEEFDLPPEVEYRPIMRVLTKIDREGIEYYGWVFESTPRLADLQPASSTNNMNGRNDDVSPMRFTNSSSRED